MTQVTIHHNPDCGTSRNTLALIRNGGVEPTVIEYKRPIVVTPWGAKLCRPSEVVLEILPLPQPGPFVKENGELVIDSDGRRVSSRGH
jgi:arsenate reductase-like glutaredoxin family protein